MTTDMLLERLDLALADDPSADAEMLALVHDVRDEAPQMSAEFSAQLDDRVRGGFAPAPRAKRRLRMPNLFVMGPVAAVAAVALVVVVTGTGGGSSSPIQTADHAISLRPDVTAAAPEPKSEADSAASGSAGGVAPQASVAPSTPTDSAQRVPQGALSATTTASPGRQVERSTQLTLVTPTDNLQTVANGVVRATQQAQGFVGNSQVQISGNHGSATFTLRIPSAHLSDALTALTRLAHVTSMNQSTQDITDQFAKTNTRVDRLTGRLNALRRTKQTRATLALELRLKQAIAAQQVALEGLHHRADYVTVDLSITGTPPHHHVAPAHHGGGFTPGKALHTAGRIAEIGAGVLLIAATILIPLALLVAAFWLATRSARRRNREAALKTS